MEISKISIEKLNDYIFNLRYRYDYIEVRGGLCKLKYASVQEALEHC